MDWYDALKAWQDGRLPAEDAIRIAEVEDVFELWELALGCGIDIKLAGGDRDHIAAVIEGYRQVQRGETVDTNDVILEVDLLLAEMSEKDLKRRLRLKWIPTPDGFEFEDIADYERFLSLSHDEQTAFLRGLGDDEYHLYETLIISHACYRDPNEK